MSDDMVVLSFSLRDAAMATSAVTQVLLIAICLLFVGPSWAMAVPVAMILAIACAWRSKQ